MKKLFFIIIICVSAAISVFIVALESKNLESKKVGKAKNEAVFTENKESIVVDNKESAAMEEPVVIKYSEYKNRVIELEYESHTKIIGLRTSYDCIADEELEVLKAEASKICTGTSVTSINGGRYTIHYLGGYPVWEPFQSLGPNYSYVYLQFSHRAIMKGNHLYITGEKYRQNYYPYDKSVGSKLINL